MENFLLEFEVLALKWGHTEISRNNGDDVHYSTLKIQTHDYTIMVFRNDFNCFPGIEIGHKFKVEVSPWKGRVCKFVKLYVEYPLLVLAEKECKAANYLEAIQSFKEHFKIWDFRKPTPIDITSYYMMYYSSLLNCYKLNISNSNPYFEKVKNQMKDYVDREDKDALRKKIAKVAPISVCDTFRLPTGRYEKKTVYEIIMSDPEYIFSRIIDDGDFLLHKYFFVLDDFDKVQNFKDAFEINSIKNLLLKNIRLEEEFYFYELERQREEAAEENYRICQEAAFGSAFEGDVEAWNDHYK